MACCRSNRCNQPQPAAAPSCCCHPSPPPPCPSCLPPLPPPTDPILLQTVISHLLHNPQTHTFPQHPPHITPSTSTLTDLGQCCGQCQTTTPSQLPHNNHAKQTRFPRQQQQHHSPHAVDQLDDPHYYSLLIASLRQRIETLELALHGLSPSPSLSLRDFAARTIQTHFRVYLVRRSRALYELKELASIKSHLNVLRSTLSTVKRGIDFGSVSRQARKLVIRLESIEGEDQLVRDSKRSVSRELDQLLASIDELFVKRQVIVSRVTTATTQLTKIDDNSSRANKVVTTKSRLARKDSKSQNHELSNEEMRLIDSLRNRIDRINSMSKALDRDVGTSSRVNHNVGRNRGRGSSISDGRNCLEQQRKTNVAVKNNCSPMKTGGKKRVAFLEDGNVTWVHDVNEKESLTMQYEEEEEEAEAEEEEEGEEEEQERDAEGDENTAADLANHEVSEEEDEHDEAPNHGAEEGSVSSSQASDDVVTDDPTRSSGKFVFSPPEPLKMEDRAGLAQKSHGVRIIG